MKVLGLLVLFALSAFAQGGEALTGTWVGISSLVIFVVGYYIIATEESYHINKAKPALFIGTFIFMLIGFYFYINGLDKEPLSKEVDELILEIAEIFFFLMVAMTYIETLIERNVFNALKYNLVSKGYSYKKLFWITGILAFFISPVADNLTTALILSTVLITIEKEKRDFLVPGAINIVVAANAGGAWSPFGDITTLMSWTAEKAGFVDFFYLFPASFIGWIVTAWLLSLFVPKDKPHFDAAKEHKEEVYQGGKVVIALGLTTIISAVLAHQLFHLPAMWGMLFGLSLLKLYSYRLKRKYNTDIKIFKSISKIEHDTLLFFVGILAAVGGLHFLGYLDMAAKLYGTVGPDAVNIGVGFLSAIVDNVPVMSAVLKSNPDMGMDQWLLVTMTAGIGGSLISFGSAAGVGVMGKLRGIYTFGAHLKYAWTILIGYILSIIVWYIQFEVFKDF
ncbi:MAG: sodium:proton antiporter NhaD [Campylobacteraceae bacterium]|nr:sodium:proton antiporter NhaD [Campylobacteraceae bacterium]